VQDRTKERKTWCKTIDAVVKEAISFCFRRLFDGLRGPVPGVPVDGVVVSVKGVTVDGEVEPAIASSKQSKSCW
jgi:hypothetical protein